MSITSLRKKRLIELKNDIEAIVGSKVVGLDFISVGSDIREYDVHLLHGNPQSYLKHLGDKYFSRGCPSLLFYPSREVFFEFPADKSSRPHPPLKLDFLQERIVQETNVEWIGKDAESWNLNLSAWLESIKGFDSRISHFAFVKHEVGTINQRFYTALFVYLDQEGGFDKKYYQNLIKSFLYLDALEYLVPRQLEAIRSKAIESTLSKLLARNFSHHIGSHVTIRANSKALEAIAEESLKQQSRKLQRVVKDKSELSQIEKNNRPDFLKRAWALKDRLDTYELERNEFVADTGRSLKPMHFFKDVLKPFIENRLLMRYIAASEGYTVRDGQNRFQIHPLLSGEKIEFRYGDDQKGFIYPYSFQELADQQMLNSCRFYCLGKELITDPKVLISHPHAFYSILENIIRNTVKHNPLKGKDSFTLFVNLADYTDSSFRLEIWDSISEVQEDSKTYADLRKRFKAQILKPNGEPSNENNGILDIKISANLLKAKRDFKFNASNSPVEIDLVGQSLRYKMEIPKYHKLGYLGFTNHLGLGEFHFKSIYDLRQHYLLNSFLPDFLYVQKGLELFDPILKLCRIILVDDLPQDHESVDKYYLNKIAEDLSRYRLVINPNRPESYVAPDEMYNLELGIWDASSTEVSGILSTKTLVIDHHHNIAKNLMIKGLAFQDNQFPSGLAYMAFDKKLPSFSDFDRGLGNSRFLLEVFHVLSKRILILDERIAEIAIASSVTPLWEGHLYLDDARAANIYIITQFKTRVSAETNQENVHLNFSPLNNLEVTESESTELNLKFEGEDDFDFNSLDYFVIHRSLYLKSPDLFYRYSRDYQIKLIITSGSGSLNEIKQEVFFLPYANLKRALASVIDKLELVRLFDYCEFKTLNDA